MTVNDMADQRNVVRGLVERLRLQPHPEGGWFRETYRAAEPIPHEALPTRFSGPRNFSTAIYYLLEAGQFSAFHRIRSDEVWHFYAGDPLEIVGLVEDGSVREWRLGRPDEGSLAPQAVVPAGCWFAARCAAGGAYSLCGCTVAPGFDFADFEMASREDLLRRFPRHEQLILSFTRV